MKTCSIDWQSASLFQYPPPPWLAPPDMQRAKRTVWSVARSAIVSSGKPDTSDGEISFGAGGERRAHEMKGQLPTDLTLSVIKHWIISNYHQLLIRIILR